MMFHAVLHIHKIGIKTHSSESHSRWATTSLPVSYLQVRIWCLYCVGTTLYALVNNTAYWETLPQGKLTNLGQIVKLKPSNIKLQIQVPPLFDFTCGWYKKYIKVILEAL